MESVNTSKSSGKQMHPDQSSIRRRKLTFLITSVVVFSLIIGSIIAVFAVLKHETEAEGLSAKPSEAIQAVCFMTRYTYLCSKSLSDNLIIYPSQTMNPSKIFTLSLHPVVKELEDLLPTTQYAIPNVKNSRTLSALKDCERLFKDSMRLVNKTMEVMNQTDPDENVFKEKKSMIRILQIWMTKATENLASCITGIDYGLNTTSFGKDESRMRGIKRRINLFIRPYMENCLTILVKTDEILELFDPRFGSVLATLLLSTDGYDSGVIVFCTQYVVLVILIVMVLRLY